jgi:photosystem II stability/assembly factor-like uncharacterized protein
MKPLSPPAALALAVFFATAPAFAQNWTTVPLGTTEDILVFQNTSFSERWVAGSNGFVARSSMGITVWTPVSIGTTADLSSILESSSGNAWIGGEGGAVRVQSGVSWLIRNVPSGGQNVSLFTRNSGGAIAVGDAGGIWKTTNGGVDWVPQSSGTTVALRAGAGFITSNAWIVGDGGTILKTTNGGTLWTSMPSGTTADLYDIAEVASGVLEAVGDFGTILRSTDTGLTWTQIPSGATERLRDVGTSGANGNWHIVVGDGGVVLKTTTNGLTWCRLDADDRDLVHGDAATTRSTRGRRRVPLKTTNGGGRASAGRA